MRDASGLRTSLGSFFLGGFECSTHRLGGRRLDLLASTRHDAFAAEDYAAMRAHGLFAVRDGLRWHRIEVAPGEYDWSSFTPMLYAAARERVAVIWDLCHYGWPDHHDIWAPSFVDAFARFARAAARYVREATLGPTFYCPINEISYWAWAGGEAGHFSPAAMRRGCELKRQLVRASIAAIDAIRTVDPGARFVAADPIIHVAARKAALKREAERARLAQFEAWDMLTGAREPALCGSARHLDIVGVNFYPHNQWYARGGTIARGQRDYRPLHAMLAEVHARYGRPILIAETGAEGEHRAPWLRYVAGEAERAIASGVPVEGICLYPVLDYPGWTDDRHCEAGLLGHADAAGRRPVCAELAGELAHLRARFEPASGDRAPGTA